ncbi:MAG: polymer-forming cytoskeletal protein [Verrucomicrobia bacterium]|nr:polymer-forming cytoskeletal protein [Verrucomicrobiota bacterium]
MKPDKVNVACPHCGQSQLEPRGGYSTVCRHCGQNFRIHKGDRPAAPLLVNALATRRVVCFECGTLLDVSVEAESTMCKRCSTHVDLRDYQIDQAVSKNFRTHGAFVIGEKGYVFNTEANVGDAVIKGRLLGKLTAHRSLTIYSTAEIRGTFRAALLIIPVGNCVAWKLPLDVGEVEIAGELAANVHIDGTVRIKSTGRLFGDVQVRNLIVEPGAVLVGNVRLAPSVAPTPEPLLSPAP